MSAAGVVFVHGRMPSTWWSVHPMIGINWIVIWRPGTAPTEPTRRCHTSSAPMISSMDRRGSNGMVGRYTSAAAVQRATAVIRPVMRARPVVWHWSMMRSGCGRRLGYSDSTGNISKWAMMGARCRNRPDNTTTVMGSRASGCTDCCDTASRSNCCTPDNTMLRRVIWADAAVCWALAARGS